MSFSLVGTKWNLDEFRQHLLPVRNLWFKSVTLHHTGFPDLSMRPNGLTAQHIRNIQSYYEGTRKWDRGPHLFIDDHDINGMSPLTKPGIHAASFNSTSIGIEVLGNYDVDDPLSGRGFQCWNRAAKVTRLILDSINMPIDKRSILFHRDDPKTRKSCPGMNVRKEWFIGLVKSQDKPAQEEETPAKENPANDHLKAIDWQISQIQEEAADLPEDRRRELDERLRNIKWRALKVSTN